MMLSLLPVLLREFRKTGEDEAEWGLLRWAAVSGAKHVSMGRREFEQMSR